MGHYFLNRQYVKLFYLNKYILILCNTILLDFTVNILTSRLNSIVLKAEIKHKKREIYIKTANPFSGMYRPEYWYTWNKFSLHWFMNNGALAYFPCQDQP